MENTAAALLLRAQAADAEAFGQLYALYANELYAYALAVLRDPHDAEDAVQEACVRVYRAVRSIRKPERFKAYFFKTLSNTAKTLARKRTLTVVTDEIEPTAPDITNDVHIAELRADLQKALAALKDDERQVVLLSAIAGLRSAEIAEALGMTAGTVRSKLSRALRKMRPFLAETGRESE